MTDPVAVAVFSWLLAFMALRLAKALENQVCHYSPPPLSERDARLCEQMLFRSDLSILWWLLTPIPGGLIWVFARTLLTRSARAHLAALWIIPLLPLAGIIGAFLAGHPYWLSLEWQTLVTAVTDW
ncbi:hypothetical protein [Streptosporangium sp. NPDC002721]|uniref:hypothetical protein n=1 Tax=Streptosporangium sp. NPDC002721 TaxID=3366188 RepID=UPI0036B105CC